MIKVGIVGGTGYTGIELLRILARHPKVHLHTITSRKEAGLAVADVFPSLRHEVSLHFSSNEQSQLMGCNVVFFATPHGVAMTQARELLEKGVKIIDLAADFRLSDPNIFEAWYGMPHACPDLLQEAVYGLPEFNRDKIKEARIIANPGCYPTTMQLGYAPLLKNRLIATRPLIADCKSGVSGAGRKEEIGLLFSEMSDNFKAYSASKHRHVPETVEQLKKIAHHNDIELIFTPHLIPMVRGMHATLYATLLETMTNEALQDLFETMYKNEPFVDVMPFGSHPETRSTRGSNTLRIALHRPHHGQTVVVLVAQDNLTKGASGQAVQCMNIMFGLEETTGLTYLPLMP